MCGRTALTASPEDLRELFGLDETPHVVPHYNVPPSQPLHAVRVVRGGTRRTLELLRWGLVPYWADDPKMGHRLALSRVETVAATPAFRDALRRHRCLVVVDGFYEWKHAGAKSKKGTKPSQPFFVRRPDGAPFALAGVWDRWVSRDGEVLESCAIVTQPARPPVDAIHDRMPLVLEKEDWDRWLDPQLGDVTALLRPRSPALVAHPVSTYVNDPRHDDAQCAEPSEPAQRTMFDN
jgi:putative SOS response-associated peptidase YedK